MKALLIITFASISLFLSAQNIDSLDHDAHLNSLIKLNVDYINQGNFTKAIECITEAKELGREVYGDQSHQYAQILDRIGDTYTRKGDFEEAELVFIEAINIFESKEIDKPLKQAEALRNYATLLAQTGKFEAADTIYIKVLFLLKEEVGERHDKYAFCLNNRGTLFFNTGQLDKAKTVWIEATDIWKEVHGIESSQYSAGLHNLGNLHWRLSRYEEAKQLYENALTIRDKVLHENDPQLGITYLCLGSMNAQIGQYENAEPLLVKALSILEKSIGPQHPYYLDGMNNLAIFYSDQGDQSKAIQTQKKIIEIQKGILGNKSPRLMEYYLNMALFQKLLDNPEECGEFVRESYKIQQEHFQEDTLKQAEIMVRFSNYYSLIGSIDSAEQILLEAKSLLEDSNFESHINYANCNFELGVLYNNLGRYDEAIVNIKEAKKQFEEKYGSYQKEYIKLNYYLGSIYSKLEKHELAEQYYSEALINEKQQLTSATQYLSDKELQLFIKKYNYSNNRFLCEGQRQPSFAKNVYDNALFHKGFIQNDAIQFNQVAAKDSLVSDKYLLLKSYKRRLAEEYSKPLADRADITKLKEDADSLEKDITRKLKNIGRGNQVVLWHDVKSKLKRGSAAMEMIKFTFEESDSVMYAAVVVRYDSEEIQFVPLFEEKQLESIFHNKNDYANNINNIYKYHSNTEKNYDLNTLIIKPLSKAIEGVETIYYSPIGLLHRLNFDAIQINESTLFGEQYRLNRVLSTRQFVTADTTLTYNNKIALFGGIIYDVAESPKLLENESITIETKKAKKPNFLNTDAENKRGLESSFNVMDMDSTKINKSWSFLKWTGIEVDGIEIMLEDEEFEISLLKGSRATEESFKALETSEHSPRIVHLATHGFFFSDVKTSYAENNSWNDNQLVFKKSEDPMIRSGLIMANANYAWKNGKPINGETEDGILTSYEISQMNLNQTELVVLSACETGLGQINGNEGVYGLQRAFKIAGVNYIIMSLWQVPDFKTQELMSFFYYNYLHEGLEIHDAFRLAQQEMRRRYPDPFSWAGFVLID